MVYHLWGLGVSIDDEHIKASIGASSAATFDYRRVTPQFTR